PRGHCLGLRGSSASLPAWRLVRCRHCGPDIGQHRPSGAAQRGYATRAHRRCRGAALGGALRRGRRAGQFGAAGAEAQPDGYRNRPFGARMTMFRQIWTVTALNFKSLRARFWQSMVIVCGLGATIGVLLSMLSMTAGMKEAYANSGSPDRAIVVSLGANSEGGSSIPRASAPIIMDAPGIAKYKDGKPFADAGLNTNVPVLRLNGSRTNAVLRGLGDKGIALRPEFRLVSGRMFEPGKRELMVGVGAQTIYQHMRIGDKVIMPDGEWPIIGVYTTGDILDGQLIGDAETLMAATRHPNYNTILIRLASRDSLSTLNHALTTNPALSVTVMRHSDWYKMVSDL